MSLDPKLLSNVIRGEDRINFQTLDDSRSLLPAMIFEHEINHEFFCVTLAMELIQLNTATFIRLHQRKY